VSFRVQKVDIKDRMILAIVQVRMSSARLPGKVMKEVLGKPMISYLLERLRSSRRIDKIMLATTDMPSDDPVAAYVQSIGFDVFRGSEDDVLARYYQAARQYDPEHVVRITGDCTFIDAAICDRLIAVYLERKVDYAYLGPSFAEGLDCEIFKFEVLKKACQNAQLRSEREHVTRYIHNNPGMFTKFQLDNSCDDSRYRIVLDEPEDFLVLKILIEHFLKDQKLLCGFEEVKTYLDEHPDIQARNAHVIRNEGLLKSLQTDGLYSG